MPLERIMNEKTSADHLFYVSLKYTKTCDVMLNLIDRWRSMIELCVNAMLERAKKRKIIKEIPVAPKLKVTALKIVFKKEEDAIKALELYEFFKKVPQAERIRESEFRKNVCLTIIDAGKETRIDMDKLKEYAEIIEKFIKFVRVYLA